MRHALKSSPESIFVRYNKDMWVTLVSPRFVRLCLALLSFSTLALHDHLKTSNHGLHVDFIVDFVWTSLSPSFDPPYNNNYVCTVFYRRDYLFFFLFHFVPLLLFYSGKRSHFSPQKSTISSISSGSCITISLVYAHSRSPKILRDHL